MSIGVGNTVKIVISGDIKDVQRKLSQVEKDMTKFEKVVGKSFLSMRRAAARFNTPLAKIAATLGGLALAAKALNLGKSFIEAGSEVENYRVRLEAMYKSQQKANEAFKFMDEFAAKVPFSLQGIIKAGVSLESFGADIQTWLEPLADVAAFMGTDIPEAASAMGRAFAAGAGAADIFRERGILQVIKATTGLNDLTKLTLPQFREAMISAFTDPDGKIAGSANKLAKTWTGKLSMLSDAWFRFKRQIADSGLFEYLKSKADETMDKIEELKKNGKLDEWAKNISDGMVRALKDIRGMLKDIKENVLPVLKGIGNTIKTIYNDFKQWPSWVTEMGLFGAVLFGAKGAVLVGGAVHTANAILDSLRGASEVIKGNLSFKDFASADYSDLKKMLDDLDKRKKESKKTDPIRDALASMSEDELAALHRYNDTSQAYLIQQERIRKEKQQQTTAQNDLNKAKGKGFHIDQEQIALEKELKSVIGDTDAAQLAHLQKLLAYAKEHKKFAAAIPEIEKQIAAIQNKSSDAEKKRLAEQQKAWKEHNRVLIELADETARDMQDSFSDFFFDAFEGRLKKLSDYLKAFATSVKQSISSALASAFSARLMPQFGNAFAAMGMPNMAQAFNPALAGHMGAAGGGGAGWLGALGPMGSMAGLATVMGGYQSAGWKGAIGSGLGYGAGYIGGATLASFAAPAVASMVGGSALGSAAGSLVLGALAPGIGILVGALVAKALSRGDKARAKRLERWQKGAGTNINDYFDFIQKAGIGDIFQGGESDVTKILGKPDRAVDSFLQILRSGQTDISGLYGAQERAKGFNFNEGDKNESAFKSIVDANEQAMYKTYKTIEDFFQKFPEYKQDVIDLNLKMDEAYQYVLSKEDEVVAAMQARYQAELSWIDQLNRQISSIDQNIIDVVRSTYSPEQLVGAQYGDLQSLMEQMRNATVPEDFQRFSTAAQQAVNTWYNQVQGLGDQSLTTQAQTEALQFLADLSEAASGQIAGHETTAADQRQSMIDELQKIYDAVAQLNDSLGGGMESALVQAKGNIDSALTVNLNIDANGASYDDVIAALDRAIETGDSIAAKIKDLIVG